MPKPQIYTVKYEVGPYKGMRDVRANNAEEAKTIVKGFIRTSLQHTITLSKYSESYEVLGDANEIKKDYKEDV